MKKTLLSIVLTCLVFSSFAQNVHTVLVGPYMTYTPSQLTIELNDSVTFILEGGTHDANFGINTLTGQSFGNPAEITSLPVFSSAGVMGTITFEVPGTYNYDCSVYGHASMGMVGQIIVNESADCLDDNEAIATIFSGGMSISSCTEAIAYLGDNYGYSEVAACEWNGMPMFDFGGDLANVCECSCADLEPENSSVVDVIVASEFHTTLETAVLAAGLAETLSGDGPFTVFAPTDAAFSLLPEGTLEALLADPSGQLTSILSHHVHSGSALSTDLSDGMMIPTVAGTNLDVTITDGMVYISNAQVVTADIVVDNGVVHVIDAVLLPEILGVQDDLMMEQEEYMYSIDVLGKRVNRNSIQTIVFDIYSSGNVVKRFSIKY